MGSSQSRSRQREKTIAIEKNRENLVIKNKTSVQLEEQSILDFVYSDIMEKLRSTLENPNKSVTEKEEYLKNSYNMYLTGHSGQITSLVLTADSNYVISASKDSKLKVWNIKKAVQIKEIIFPFPVFQVVISKDSRFLYILVSDRKIIELDFDLFEQQNVFSDFSYPITSIALGPKDELYIAGGFVGSQNTCAIHVFNLNKKRETGQFCGHRAAANEMVLTDDGKFMFSCSGGTYAAVEDNSVRKWNTRTNESEAVFINLSSFVNCVAVADKKKIVICGLHDRTIFIFDFSLQKLHSFKGHLASIQTLFIVPNSQSFISGSLDSTIKIWDLDKYWLIREFITSSVFCVVANDKKIIGGHTCAVKSWDNETFQEFELPGHNGKIDFIKIIPDSPYMYTGDTLSVTGGTVRIWNLMNKRQEKVITFPLGFETLEITKDGQGALFIYPDGVYRAYSLRKSKQKKIEHRKAFDFLLLSNHSIKIR